jgi:IS30 family transposase
MTKVDLEKLKLLHAQGKSNREIAKELCVHHNSIAFNMKKFGLHCNTANQPIEMV